MCVKPFVKMSKKEKTLRKMTASDSKISSHSNTLKPPGSPCKPSILVFRDETTTITKIYDSSARKAYRKDFLCMSEMLGKCLMTHSMPADVVGGDGWAGQEQG